MTRVKRGNVAKKRRKKTLRAVQGFRGSSATLYRTANQQKIKALHYSYRDRRQKKRNFRSLWITRLNGAARAHGWCYNSLIHMVNSTSIEVNRKILSQLSVYDDRTFAQLVHLS
uniref:Large ribosomal subunit protein bL20c n=1 Tax=Xylochloris irregularis TaxID=480381 RepID=A0A097KMC4_9CHLO|nr:ribosomal protein L20 [Xylochloris irregularis]AIT94334.1 ribosomal protein L20 [Xylochloris irregularis]